MLCCYLDDAGNTGTDLTNADQPIHYTGALMVPDDAWRSVATEIAAVKRYARTKGFAEQQIELHGKEIFQGERQGHGWGAVSFPDRIDIYRTCLKIAAQLNLRMALGCCDKRLLAARYCRPEHPHAIAMWLCLERVARFAKSQNALAFVVADDCSYEIRETTRKVLQDYRTRGAPFGGTVDFACLIDTIHFMDSKQSPHIQLCDLLLYAIRRFEAKPSERIRQLAETALATVWERRTIPY